MAVIQMMNLIRNLLRGKLCNPIFIMMTNNKEERDKEIVHDVLFLQLLLINILHVVNFHRTFNKKGAKNKNKTKGDSDIWIAVVQMMSLNKNLLCGKLCNSMFLIMTIKKGER